MAEYFIYANSFAAPFFSDTSTAYVEADTPDAALQRFADEYKHPAGLYSAVCYASADAHHKGQKPLSMWLCNHEIEKARLTKDLGSFSYRGDAPGQFEIDGVAHTIKNPKHGRLVAANY